MEAYCVLSVFLLAIPVALEAVSVSWVWEGAVGWSGRSTGRRHGGCRLSGSERGGVAEKGTVLLRMGVEYCPTSSPPLHGLWGGGKQAGGLSAIRALNHLNPMLGFQRFQVFIGLALNGNCVILKIGKRYDHDDGGAFDALQEEKGRPEGLLKHGRHVAVPGHTRCLPPILREEAA